MRLTPLVPPALLPPQRRSCRFLALAIALATLLAAPHALAQNATPPENCPPGSVGKASGAFAWCEPTVCIIDTDCGAGMVCRTLGLCMNAGSVDDAKKDASTR